MDLVFDKLLDFNISRITRPTHKHEFAQLHDPVLLQTKPDQNLSTDESLSSEKMHQLW
jgi:hypothetical protein